jgi:hypothetical protein
MDLIVCNSELLSTLNNQSTLGDYYPKESVIKHEPLLICGDKLSLQNKNIYDHYMDARPVSNSNRCVEPFNTRSQRTSELQRGYSRNIDIDSELKCINYYADKCFYDRYKVDPRNPPPSMNPKGEPNRISCVSKDIVHDYAAFRRERLLPRQMPGCLTLEQFPECSHPTSAASRQLYQLPSASDNHCLNWGCQQAFNNFTKRKLLSPFNNVQDINPSTLCCTHQS